MMGVSACRLWRGVSLVHVFIISKQVLFPSSCDFTLITVLLPQANVIPILWDRVHLHHLEEIAYGIWQPMLSAR
jgi:hypothetical protein